MVDSDNDGVADSIEVANGTSPSISNIIKEITVDTDLSQSADFTSLNDAIASIRGILRQPHVIRTRSSSGIADTDPVRISSIFSNRFADLKIILEDSYVLDITATKGYFHAIDLMSEYVTLKGEGGKIIIRNNGHVATYGLMSFRQAKDSLVIIENLSLEGQMDASQPSYGLKAKNAANKHVIRNNVVTGFVGSGSYGIFAYYENYFYNNTVSNNQIGFRWKEPSGEIYNTISVLNNGSDYHAWMPWSGITNSNNISSDTTANISGDRSRVVEFIG